MKLNTTNLKKMLSHMSKCKPNNLLEITNYYELSFNEDGLVITGTDGSNYISIFSEEGAQDKADSIIVKADQFTKLVSKITSEFLDLQVKEDHLQVKANGTYKCEMFSEEEYPEYEIDIDRTEKVSAQQLIHSVGAGKNSKSNTPADGVLFSYLVRDNHVITADSIKVCCTPVDGLSYELLIPPTLANLMPALDGDVIKVSLSKDEQSVLLEGSNVTIYGALAEGVDEYPDVMPMFDEPYPHVATIDTQSTIQALDRLKLFLGAYDGGLIDLTLTDGALIISTLSGSNEILPYANKLEGTVDCEYRINGQYLADLIGSMIGVSYKIHFGEEDSIRLESETDKFILATADNE